MAAWTGLTQVQAKLGPSVEMERETQAPTPNQESICNWYPVANEKLVSSEIKWGIFNTPCLAVDGQHKTN